MAKLALCWVGPYLFKPWCSPLLRWRMETYGVVSNEGIVLHADALTSAQFYAFLRQHAKAILQFLRWAATLQWNP